MKTPANRTAAGDFAEPRGQRPLVGVATCGHCGASYVGNKGIGETRESYRYRY